VGKETVDLEKLHELHRSGKIAKAKTGYLAFLKAYPTNAEALHALGLIYVEEKELDKAADYLRKAIEYGPQNPTLQLHLANILKRQGLFSQATKLLTETISSFPTYVPALNNLGTLYYSQGKITEAIHFYKLALEKEPHYIDASYNLGLALTKNEELDKAAEIYQQLLLEAPEHSAARYQLATVYMRQEKWDAALELFLELALTYANHFETQVNLASCFLKKGAFKEAKKYYLKALALNPQDQQVLFNLGHLNSQQNTVDEAIPYYQKLIELNSNDFAAHNNLGILFLTKKQHEAATQHFEAALRIEPHNVSLQHLLKVLQKDQNLSSSPPEYLKSLFDYYADHYEPHLLNTLDYQVPELLHQAFLNSRQLMNKKLAILDLGCGTGLCGEVFKFQAVSLVGIDLSSKMLALASEKKIYDELHCDDFLHYLEKNKTSYDLILAGDVLVYIGDLRSTFRAIKQVLPPQGLFIFNVENTEKENYQLNPSGRFSHKKSYLEKLAQEEGFSIIYSETAVTRLQDKQPVKGQIYVLQALPR
jgi:predicted TPR repeat methyltransferase